MRDGKKVNESLPLVLRRKSTRRFMTLISSLGLALFFVWKIPIAELILSGWNQLDWVLVFFIAVLIFAVWQSMRVFWLHAFFENVLISHEGVFRFGYGGQKKIISEDQMTAVRRTARGVEVYNNDVRLILFPESIYYDEGGSCDGASTHSKYQGHNT